MGFGWRNVKDEWDRFRTSETGATVIGFVASYVGGGVFGGLTAGAAGGYSANRQVAEAKKAEQDVRRIQSERAAAQLRADEAKIGKAVAESAADRRRQGQDRQNAGIPMLEDNVKSLSGGTLLTSPDEPITLGKAKPLSNTTMLGG